MAMSIVDAIMNGHSRTIQKKGEITLPKEWRDENGLQPGDGVALLETEDGTLEVHPTDDRN